jgi:septal ring factor EnvC (AmiA/AmiB activator)
MPITVAAQTIPRTLGGVVVADMLRVRELPATDARILKRLPSGSRISIHNHLAGWYEILLEDGTRGFISDKPKHVELRETPRNEAEVKQLQTEMSSHESRFSGIVQQELSVIEQLHRIDIDIIRASRELDRLQRQKQEVDEMASKLAIRQKQALEAYREAQGLARERLRARYRMMQSGAASVVVASASSAADWVFRKDMLGFVLQADERIRKRLAQERDGYERLSAEIAEQQRSRQEIGRMIQMQLAALSEEKNRRKQVLQGVRSKKVLEMQAIEGLKEAMNHLERWFDQWKDEERIETPEQGARLDSADARPFDRMKGKLSHPVSGKIQTTAERSGLMFRTQAGEPVHAVFSGKVVYSDWFKGYGNLIIVDHGKHYFTIYAHLTDRFKSIGQPVQTDEVIGTAGTTDMDGRCGIYFEMRNRAKSIDCKPWFRGSIQGPISSSQGKEGS